MNMSLHYIERNLRFITTDGSNPFRTNAVKEHWVVVKKKYATYRNQVCSVRSYVSYFYSVELNILTRSMRWKTTITLSPTSHMPNGYLLDSLKKRQW